MTQALDLEAYVGHLIRRAEQKHTALWSAQVSREVTSQQFAVLNALAASPGIDQRTLAAATSLDRSTVNIILRRLTDHAYVSQNRDPEDRRRTVLRLTAEGIRLIETLIPRAQSVNSELLQVLPAGDREAALRILRRLAGA
ncbi:MarR family winged helix-turn-helix transcriptional regulator [Streptomyces durocortorensis]|uniref:Winged helix-turn-helix transcriptional regulator n=1 Tax=Streptomyces durocortorensis TaxID=2811104 RepID=A0ABS2HTE7_9ACTN|nr:MarR family winged helix-turn-helix transcriptional regulator [Streptomyces durocortorensis]MBM7054319.1 winged helix-turn-helix transcriptional regulator [Streptomyces durocortorensis]